MPVFPQKSTWRISRGTTSSAISDSEVSLKNLGSTVYLHGVYSPCRFPAKIPSSSCLKPAQVTASAQSPCCRFHGLQDLLRRKGKMVKGDSAFLESRLSSIIPDKAGHHDNLRTIRLANRVDQPIDVAQGKTNVRQDDDIVPAITCLLKELRFLLPWLMIVRW